MGVIDGWGASEDGQHTLLSGWIGNPWRDQIEGALRLSFGGTSPPANFTAEGMLFPSAAVASIGSGILLLCDVPPGMIEGMSIIGVHREAACFKLRTAPSLRRVSEEALRDMMSSGPGLLSFAGNADVRSVAPTRSSALLRDAGAQGGVTIRHVIDCGSAGMLVLGSLSAPEPILDRVTLDARAAEILVPQTHIVSGAVMVDPDGLPCVRFAFRLENFSGGQAAWLTLTMANGKSARVALPAPAPCARGSLLIVLEAVEAVGTLDDAFDHVFGPAISALHDSDVGSDTHLRRIDFGRRPARPSVSLIIPLHKRIDYFEVQLGLFCGQACLDDAEILFVVDDPPRRQEAEMLAASAFARFGIAFSLLMPGRNLGFARASNLGLHMATGRHVCFLNSDVFPKSPDWMARLIGGLSQPNIGIMAPMLLFADGSVQHRGMVLQAMDRLGSWHFPRHLGKGMRPEGSGVVRVPAVTGACMVMTRQTAEELGGFDEGFVIGDFEDYDLCLRLGQLGLDAAVDLDVRALHLERQSQGAGAPWRMGATLYNAWRHERRWFAGRPS